MKQASLARWVVGVVAILALVAIYVPSAAGPMEGAEASSTNGYDAGSNLFGPVVSLSIFALYVWVLRLSLASGRAFAIAGIWRKFFAVYVDLMFAMLIVVPWTGLIAVLVEAARNGHFAWYVHRDQATTADYVLSFALVLPSMFCMLLYFAWPQHRGRQSPGELLLGIGIKYTNDSPLTLSQAAGRVLLGLFAFGTFYITVPMALADPEKRMWQDKAFGTRVVRWTD